MNDMNEQLLKVFPEEFLDGLEEKFNVFERGAEVIQSMTFECINYLVTHKPELFESCVYDETKINKLLTNYFLN
jgi:hypothetical protein